MAELRTLDIKLLHELLSYDAFTGDLCWRQRTAEHFTTERIYNSWNAKNAGRLAGHVNQEGYRAVAVFRTQYLAHRIVFAMQAGQWPNGLIDHINGKRLDNRIENLRVVSDIGNGRNQKRRSTNRSGVNGVHWYKAKGAWQASIMENGKQILLGRFARLQDAAAARQAAEIRLNYHPNHGRVADNG